ncbi:hypothetical protein EHEL_041460 [Encephalitozoon hellem ATCC 50504]|uniref:LisH domain-containing protein n=1 Tax=Encephalitozoon hellem TaxID=27973 RepID=A0A9Q9F866_ENCHE|nr:uncharacterized protein EHEL_041460 [Encephalitozoon hellem ATCC 50504]AFM98194.1 hypothetical protein EHEL_041460 [Encephalitozoon hellem ATCC 50504]UTX43043.1 hypothetical protein GPU96_04g07780 [Encephalitozoon hellem]WEL38500.1 hypothetical protein PFJ87_04g01760 [Encephalitozoon hellem]|eukprot:XP_003887175.1 hypothetical protein EHEL_041460 [Encephalitozoon hellem ATCC 50504]
MGDHTYKKKDSGVYDALNMLVYDYLSKMKYEGSAKVFFNEASLGDFKPTEGMPILAQWYAAFHDISAVRSGLSSNAQDLSRIEGIMMKLENEKRRYQNIGRIDPTSMGYGGAMDPYKQYPMYYQPQQFDQRKMYEMYGHVSPPVDAAPRFYDPRKAGMGTSGYKAGQGYPRYPRFEDQNASSAKIPPRQFRDEGKSNSATSPSMTAAQSNSSPLFESVLGTGDRLFGLKEVMAFVPNEHTTVCSAVARDHKLLFIASSNRTITAVNLLSGKSESVVETDDKQVIEMKIRECEGIITIVCGVGGSELILVRCVIKECITLEIFGALRGHTTSIVSYEVLDSIHSLDSGGIMRKWSLEGVFEREEVLSGEIHHICCISEDNFMFADRQRVYVYDFELNIEMMEILKGQALGIKRIKEGFIVVFRNQVIWLDKRIQKVKILNVNENIKTAALIDEDLVAVSSQSAWFDNGKSLTKMKLHETSIVSLDGVNVFRKPSVVSCSANGECKIWIRYIGD